MAYFMYVCVCVCECACVSPRRWVCRRVSDRQHVPSQQQWVIDFQSKDTILTIGVYNDGSYLRAPNP